MKKLFIILLMTLLPLAAAAAQGKSKALPRQQMMTLMGDFSGRDGFDVVNVGRLKLGLVKALVRRSLRESGEDGAAALALLGGIKSVSIVHFEDASPDSKARFVRRLDRMLEDVDLLMEAKDDGEQMSVFGVVDDSGDRVTDFVVWAPKECALICLYGSMSMKQLARFMQQ